MTTHRVASPDQMRAWGIELAHVLRAGDLVILSGPLGAGKTTLTQGIAAGLGVGERVTSPTFVISHEHRGTSMRLVHVDAYRLSGSAELEDLDLNTGGAVTVIEWGAGVGEGLADDHLHISITPGADEVRELTCTGTPGRWPTGAWPC